MDSTQITIGLGTIVVLGVGMQWLARRVRVPAILLLLAAGMLVGPGLDLVNPSGIFGDALFPVVSMAVSLLLFEGGLGLDIAELRERGARPVVRLVTVGVLITWAAATVVAVPLFDLSWGLALLLGALLVVSGPTVVAPLLHLARPRQPTATILTWEGIVIDPIGATLGLVVLQMITGGDDPVVDLLSTAGVGIVTGIGVAILLVLALRSFSIPDDLELAVTFMAAIAAFALSEAWLEEAGLFATTALGVALANQRFVQVRRIASFGHDIGVIVLGGLFIVLAADASPASLVDVAAPAVALSAVLVVLVRPVVGWVCTARCGLPVPDRLFVGALAPRGIVAAATSSLFALRLQNAGMATGSIDSIVFLVIVATCLVYGLSVVPVARGLGIAEPEADGVLLVGAQPWVLGLADALTDAGTEVVVLATGQYELADEGRAFRVITAPAVSDLLDGALGDVGTALIASLDDEHNAVALASCLDELPRREVFVLPAGRRAPVRELDGVEGPGPFETDDEELEVAPVRNWGRRPFLPAADQAELAEAFARTGVRALVVDEGASPAAFPDGIVLAVRRATGAVELAPNRKHLPLPGDTVLVVGGGEPAEGLEDSAP